MAWGMQGRLGFCIHWFLEGLMHPKVDKTVFERIRVSKGLGITYSYAQVRLRVWAHIQVRLSLLSIKSKGPAC